MNEAIEQMLATYSPASKADYENAIKEILQELILLGLYRADFFEKAAFYGGSAMRIVHGLNRFSEDLDFTLFKQDPLFAIDSYFPIISRELEAYGFKVELNKIKKNKPETIESAFLKTNTHLVFLDIEGAKHFSKNIQKGSLIKIKFEIDIDPPVSFDTEIKTLLLPTPYTVKILTLPSLFAGKMHAVLMRKWKLRVKGRDFYDLAWFLSRDIPLKKEYLEEKLLESTGTDTPLTREILISLFKERISQIDWQLAKQDILPFISDKKSVEIWSEDFFSAVIDKIRFE